MNAVNGSGREEEPRHTVFVRGADMKPHVLGGDKWRSDGRVTGASKISDEATRPHKPADIEAASRSTIPNVGANKGGPGSA